MTEVQVFVAFDAAERESVEDLAPLTRELALDLHEVGVVDDVPRAAEEGAKGAGEAAVAVLSVLITADPTYVRALVDTVLAFLRRHDGRRAQLRVGEVELVLDQPSGAQVDRLIDIAQDAIARAGNEPAHR